MIPLRENFQTIRIRDDANSQAPLASNVDLIFNTIANYCNVLLNQIKDLQEQINEINDSLEDVE